MLIVTIVSVTDRARYTSNWDVDGINNLGQKQGSWNLASVTTTLTSLHYHGVHTPLDDLLRMSHCTYCRNVYDTCRPKLLDELFPWCATVAGNFHA